MNTPEDHSSPSLEAITLESLPAELGKLWGRITINPTTVFGLHAGLPVGPWVSISLHEHGGPRSWLHFRIRNDVLERAQGDEKMEGVARGWTPTPRTDLEAILEDFARKFEEGMTPVQAAE